MRRIAELGIDWSLKSVGGREANVNSIPTFNRVHMMYCIVFFVLLEENIADRTQQMEQANLTKVNSRWAWVMARTKQKGQ